MHSSPAPLAALGFVLAGLVSIGCDIVMAEPYDGGSSAPPPAYTLVIEAVNEARATPRMCGEQAFGAAAPVAWDGRLERAAERHTNDMASHGVLAHVGSDGSTVGDRVTSAGYDWRRVGENLAHAPRPAHEVVALWLASPGHCANLMHPSYVEMGVAQRDGYWTQVMGRPR